MIAVKKEWTSSDDCIRFWLTDYNDDAATKQQLMESMSVLLCPKCSPPQGGTSIITHASSPGQWSFRKKYFLIALSSKIRCTFNDDTSKLGKDEFLNSCLPFFVESKYDNSVIILVRKKFMQETCVILCQN